MKTKFLAALPLLALTLAGGDPAAAQQQFNLTIGASLPEVFPLISPLKNFVVPEVNKRLAAEGKYKINWREAYNAQLFKSNASITSLQDGITDLAWVFVIFEGSRMPLAQASTFAPGVTEDYRLMMRVHNELMQTHPPLKAEWDKYQIEFMGASSLDPTQLFTNFPVRSFEDIKNRKINAAGTIGAWVRGMGAVPVEAPLPNFYNNVKTGLAEGGMTTVTANLSVRFFEVAPYVTHLRMGSMYAGALGANKATMAKLPADVQKVIRDVGREYPEAVGQAADKMRGRAYEVLKDEGGKQKPPVTITDFPDSERVRMFKSMPNIAQDWAKQAEAGGVPARQMLSVYMDAMRKAGATPVRHWDRD